MHMYIYRVQYVIPIPRFFPTKHWSGSIRADHICLHKMIRARTLMYSLSFCSKILIAL